MKVDTKTLLFATVLVSVIAMAEPRRSWWEKCFGWGRREIRRFSFFVPTNNDTDTTAECQAEFGTNGTDVVEIQGDFRCNNTFLMDVHDNFDMMLRVCEVTTVLESDLDGDDPEVKGRTFQFFSSGVVPQFQVVDLVAGGDGGGDGGDEGGDGGDGGAGDEGTGDGDGGAEDGDGGDGGDGADGA